jgi:hypothetical protein
MAVVELARTTSTSLHSFVARLLRLASLTMRRPVQNLHLLRTKLQRTMFVRADYPIVRNVPYICMDLIYQCTLLVDGIGKYMYQYSTP